MDPSGDKKTPELQARKGAEALRPFWDVAPNRRSSGGWPVWFGVGILPGGNFLVGMVSSHHPEITGQFWEKEKL